MLVFVFDVLILVWGLVLVFGYYFLILCFDLWLFLLFVILVIGDVMCYIVLFLFGKLFM